MGQCACNSGTTSSWTQYISLKLDTAASALSGGLLLNLNFDPYYSGFSEWQESIVGSTTGPVPVPEPSTLLLPAVDFLVSPGTET